MLRPAALLLIAAAFLSAPCFGAEDEAGKTIANDTGKDIPGKQVPKPCLNGSNTALHQGCESNDDPNVPLSKKLSNSNGTIKPPPVDSKMVTPPPNTGARSMPVIPPPGSPGGNPNIVPK